MLKETHKGLPESTTRENPGNISVRVASTWEEVSGLRNTWQKFQWNPNADVEYYLTVLDCHPEVLRPHILIVERNGLPEAMLVGRVENAQLQIKFGYKTLPGPRVRRITLIHGGLLGNASTENCTVLINSLMKSLSDGEADLAWFNHLKMDSSLYGAVREVPVLSRDWVPNTQQHWRIKLPRTFEELCQSRSQNTRHNLRRYTQRLHKKFGKELVVRSFQEKAELEQLLSDTETIAAKSYHRGLEAGFVNNEETRRLIALALDRGWFRAYILYIRGEPCAFWNGLRYKNTFFTGTTAYVPEYRDLRVGTFLFHRMMEDLYREGGIQAVDFGLGDAQYKRDWADDGWQDASVCIFSSTFRGALLNSLKATSVGLSATAKMILTPERVQTCKTMWRRWLTPNTSRV